VSTGEEAASDPVGNPEEVALADPEISGAGDPVDPMVSFVAIERDAEDPGRRAE
jgi:hypothetical protein